MIELHVRRSNGACTIVSPNYLFYARTLCASYREHHRGEAFFVLIVASVPDRSVFRDEPFTAIFLEDLPFSDLSSLAMRYDILELNTNVKPTFLKFLLSEFDLERLIYLDPDVFVYSPLTPVHESLANAIAVLTPHMTSPVFDGKQPGEQEMLYNGTFNLGFIAVRRAEETLRMLDWWEARCHELGYSEGRTGLFVDQKWMNLAPGFFEGIAILRHPGCNMAFWNLHDRRLSRSEEGYVVNESFPLCFFHFSGLVITPSQVLSKNTNRFDLANRIDVASLFDEYRAALHQNHKPEVDNRPYGFEQFSDGTAVTRLARRVYGETRGRWSGDPFDAAGEFAKFAKEHRLVVGLEVVQRPSWNDFRADDWRVSAIQTALKMLLRIIGPNRYELLMRYLSHISVVRNQAEFL